MSKEKDEYCIQCNVLDCQCPKIVELKQQLKEITNEIEEPFRMMGISVSPERIINMELMLKEIKNQLLFHRLLPNNFDDYYKLEGSEKEIISSITNNASLLQKGGLIADSKEPLKKKIGMCECGHEYFYHLGWTGKCTQCDCPEHSDWRDFKKNKKEPSEKRDPFKVMVPENFWESFLEKNEKNKGFMTWDNVCLLKLKELGRTTLPKWSQAMGLYHPNSLCTVAKRLGDKIKITKDKRSKRGKFYEVKEEREKEPLIFDTEKANANIKKVFSEKKPSLLSDDDIEHAEFVGKEIEKQIQEELQLNIEPSNCSECISFDDKPKHSNILEFGFLCKKELYWGICGGKQGVKKKIDEEAK